jgi:SAM-dependent methyltransferase
MRSRAQREEVDTSNLSFWDELCGSQLALSLGIVDASEESLARFDDAYFAIYPYLLSYLSGPFAGASVLEIGLGYGTLCSELVRRGADYRGVDIARGPVELARHRLRLAGVDDTGERVVQASAHALPYPDERFDSLYTIGCLHHTGDLPRAVSEVRRVLRPGGTAVVMVYNRHSWRQLTAVTIPRLLGRRVLEDDVRAMYDVNAAGRAAPHTDFVSPRQARGLFRGFASVRVDKRNFQTFYPVPLLARIPRQRLLGSVDRVLGLDLYITARR